MDEIGRSVASLQVWARVARIAIGVFLAVVIAVTASYCMLFAAELNLLATVGPALLIALGGTNLLLIALFLLSIVPIAGWIYRAHANLAAAGQSALGYSPGWSVGSFFVPLVNFVVPFRAMRELHNRSHGEGEWQAHAPVADVSSWWSCHVAAVLLSLVTTFVALLNTIPYLYVVQPAGVNTALILFSLALLAGSAAFLFRTIGAITAAQGQMLHVDQAEVFA